MPLNLAPPQPLDYFANLVQDDQGFPLLEAAVALAQDEYPDLDIQQVLGDVDQLLARLKRRLGGQANALEKLGELNQMFFGDLGFGGNVNDYYDPDNSHLNALLRRRKGIPISLAVIWLELATGIGLDAHGVSFPGHFLCKLVLPVGQVVIDPCTGESLGREALLERLSQWGGSNAVNQADAPLSLWLQPASPREIIGRMLNNLKDIYLCEEDWPRRLAVQQRLVILWPQAWTEYRDRGLTYAMLGQPELAASDLRHYLAHAPYAPDRAAMTQRLAGLVGAG